MNSMSIQQPSGLPPLATAAEMNNNPNNGFPQVPPQLSAVPQRPMSSYVPAPGSFQPKYAQPAVQPPLNGGPMLPPQIGGGPLGPTMSPMPPQMGGAPGPMMQQPYPPQQQPQYAAGGMPPPVQQHQYPPPQPQYPGHQPSGFHQPPPGHPGPFQQPQQPRKLDPDQMPNPIQVMAENQRATTGLFVTNAAGLVPPLVTTNYRTRDQGNSSPRYIRSSMYNVPNTAEMIKQSGVPFSLILSPFARQLDGEMAPPIVDFGEMGPVRCVRCKAYISPNMQFIDGGRRFQCVLCKATTEGEAL